MLAPPCPPAARPPPLLALALGLGACGSSSDAVHRLGRARRPPSCDKASLDLLTPGRLTVATDKPAYPPYFVDDDPTNGKGFESAVAYAIAEQLGFAKDEVKWTVVPFNSSYAPGPEEVRLRRQPDLDLARARQARRLLVALLHGIPGRRRAQGLRRCSRRRWPTSRTPSSASRSARRASTPSTRTSSRRKQPQVYNDSNDVVTALKQSRVDAVVVDLPTAFYLTAAQVDGAKIVGQFDAPGGDPWGALLAKDSGLTPCVSQAIDKLKSSGELDRITQKWMGAAAGAPKLG